MSGVSGYSIYKPCAMSENALFAAICTSWTLNVYATTIIVYKAWCVNKLSLRHCEIQTNDQTWAGRINESLKPSSQAKIRELARRNS